MNTASNIHVWLVRHGERIDAIDKTWIKTASIPTNPPLTQKGVAQATETGCLIASHIKPHEFVAVYSSPYLRCVQTANVIHEVLSTRPSTPPSLPSLTPTIPPYYIHAGFTEYTNSTYFPQIPPIPLVPSSERYVELTRVRYPKYPESEAGMMSRFIQSLSAVITTYIDKESVPMLSIPSIDILSPTKHASSHVVVVTHGNGVETLLHTYTATRCNDNSVGYASISDFMIDSHGKSTPGDYLCYDDHLKNVC